METNEKETGQIHGGHRRRLKQRFLHEGLDRFEPHNILELLLFYTIPRRDTNELAHTLLNTFGSLSAVFDAPYDELVKIEGIGTSTAEMIKMIPDLTRRYLDDKYSEGCILNSTEASGRFLLTKFVAHSNEIVYLVCLDNKCRVLHAGVVFEGTVNAASISIRRIIEVALRNNATAVIIAHNHPNGIAVPSPEDLETTKQISTALLLVGIRLIDHLIFASNDYVSLADSSQFMDYLKGSKIY